MEQKQQAVKPILWNMRFQRVFKIALFFSLLGFSPGFIVLLVLLVKFNGTSFYNLDTLGLWSVAILALILFILIASAWAFIIATAISRMGNLVRRQLEKQGILKVKN